MLHDRSPAFPPLPLEDAAGLTAVDLDGDGRSELLISSRTGSNRVLKWSGGRFQEVTPALLCAAEHQTLAMVCGDIDADGQDELYAVAAVTGEHHLWDRCKEGQWYDLLPSARPQAEAHPGLVVGTATIDRRGNGRYGFVIASENAPLSFLELATNQMLVDLAQALEIHHMARGHGCVVAPLVSDHSDLFLLNQGQPPLLLRNTGMGTFLEVATEHHLAPAEPHYGQAVQVLDANQDGVLDICHGGQKGCPHHLMIRQPDGNFRDEASPALAFPSNIRQIIAADFDNDGAEELLLLNHGEVSRMFRHRTDPQGDLPLWTLTDPGAAHGLELPTVGAVVADFDEDGRLELVISHGQKAARPLSVYRGPRNGHAWVRVQPWTRFRAPARGCVVRLVQRDRVQMRVIDGGTGICQSEPVAHFGLGRDPAIDSITVTWPDGNMVVLKHPAPLQTIGVPYPGG